MLQKCFRLISFFLFFTGAIYSVPNDVIKEIFTEEHDNPLFLRQKSNFNEAFTVFSNLKRYYGIDKVIDAGCGNVLLPHHLEPDIEYVGFDIVESIVESNKKSVECPSTHFFKLDMTQELIPQGDLILCRDCFEWFSYYDIYVTLENMKASKSTYLLASTSSKLDVNHDSSTGMPREINLEASPFYFPPPLEIIHEGNSSDTHLALWKLDGINLSKFSDAIFPPITVLSKPVGGGFRWEHAGVMNSVRRGLAQRHRNFNINTDDLNSIKPNVVVVADLDAGMQAYQWKEKKQIETLIVGPNIVGSISEGNSFISWPLIDAYLAPSEWPIKNFIRFNPLLENRLRVWFAGVDETYWKPNKKINKKDKKQVLVYRKTHPEICDQVEIILLSQGFSVVSVSYGSYLPQDYRTLLSECQFAVFVSYTESQGIALAEAWSMDVPTLVWNPKEPVFYQGYEYLNTSAAPYLNPMVGEEWKMWEEFRTLLMNFDKNSSKYQPRRWVLLNMTDKVSAQTLIDLIRNIGSKEQTVQQAKGTI